MADQTPPAFDPSKPYTVEGAPAFDPSKPYTTEGDKPPQSFLQHVLHAGKKTLEDTGFMPPSLLGPDPRAYPKEGKDPISNIIHAAKLTGSDVSKFMGFLMGPEEAFASRIVRPLLTPTETRPGSYNVGTYNIGGQRVPADTPMMQHAASVEGTTHPVGTPVAIKAAKTENEARKLVSQVIKKGSGPDAVELHVQLNAARAAGQPLTISDIGGTEVQALAGTTYRAGGPARQQMRSFYERRNAEAGARTKNILEQHLTTDSYRETYEALRSIRSNNARPLWEEAESFPVDLTDELRYLLSEPEVKSGISHGLNMVRRREGPGFNAYDYSVVGFNAAGDPIVGPTPSMKLWMVAKEGLDAKIEALMNRAETAEGRGDRFGLTKDTLSYMAQRDRLLEALDNANPHYKAARDAWAGDTDMLRALSRGKDFWNERKFTPEELALYYKGLGDSEKEAFKLGVADYLQSKLRRVVDARDKGTALINSEDMRMRIRTITGSDNAANAFIAAVEREHTMKVTPQAIYGGSATAGRLADEKKGMVEFALRASHALLNALSGHIFPTLWSAARVVHMYGQRPNLMLNEAVGRLLTDPNVDVSGGKQMLAPVEVPRKRPGAPLRPPSSPVMFAPMLHGILPQRPEDATTGTM